MTTLPIASEDDDIEEAAALKDEAGATTDEDGENKQDVSSGASAEESKMDESNPFGLDVFASKPKKDERAKGKKDTLPKIQNEEENKSFLKALGESLIICLEMLHTVTKLICQTVADILVKHAFDNAVRFTSQQRDAILKLWVSIREQHTRRKQGKSVNGKLDVTALTKICKLKEVVFSIVIQQFLREDYLLLASLAISSFGIGSQKKSG